MNDFWDGYHGRNMGLPRSPGEVFGREAREREIREAREAKERREQEAADAARRRREAEAPRYTPPPRYETRAHIDPAEVARIAEEQRRWERRRRLPWIIGLSVLAIVVLAAIVAPGLFWITFG